MMNMRKLQLKNVSWKEVNIDIKYEVHVEPPKLPLKEFIDVVYRHLSKSKSSGSHWEVSEPVKIPDVLNEKVMTDEEFALQLSAEFESAQSAWEFAQRLEDENLARSIALMDVEDLKKHKDKNLEQIAIDKALAEHLNDHLDSEETK